MLRLKCAGPRGERVIPADEFFTFAYTTSDGTRRNSDRDCVSRCLIKAAPGVYQKLEKVAGDFAIASAAVQLSLDANAVCNEIGIGVTGGSLDADERRPG